MPDQFTLRQVRDLVSLRKNESENPVFVTSILVSSHVPFEQIPQYLDDWDRLGNGDIFNKIPMVAFDNNWLSGGEYPEGYTAGIKYSLGATFLVCRPVRRRRGPVEGGIRGREWPCFAAALVSRIR